MRKPQISLLTVSVSVASLLLVSTTTFAGKSYKENYKGEMPAPCPIELVLKDGFYLGLQGGYDSYRLGTDTEVATVSGIGDLYETLLDPVLSASGAVGGGFVGFGKYFPTFYNVYLGLEIFGNWSGAQSDYEEFQFFNGSPEIVYKPEYQIKSNYGIDVIPGIKLNNTTLFYVRLGYNWANIDVDQELLGTAPVAPFTTDESETMGGFHYGLGIESTFYDNWSLRAEYTHTDFNNFNANDNDGDVSVVGPSFIDTEVHPADNQFMLGLLYHFNM